MPAGIYLHIPFCKSRCSYCDFATDVYRDSGAVERYVEALISEITATGRDASVCGRGLTHEISCFRGPRIPPDTSVSGDSTVSVVSERVERIVADTIYFGGGTPSLLAAEQIERILASVYDQFFSIAPVAEITMEMNPATVTRETLAAYRSLGVNRASFGVQTFDDRALKLLARGHDANDARTTFAMLREAGFDNVSFDLIAGLPGQTMEKWESNLNEAIRLSPEHMSLYLLEIHSGTPLAEQLRSNRQPTPDPELAAEMYELMLDRLAAAGYEQYEISNFSKPGYASRHNSKYWTLDPVYGFGVSAHSFDGKQRYANERATEKYVDLIEKTRSAERLRENIDIASEFIFLGLRLEAGIDLNGYARRFGVDLMEKYGADLTEMRESGLVEMVAGRMLLTRKGKLYSNEVFAVFV